MYALINTTFYLQRNHTNGFIFCLSTEAKYFSRFLAMRILSTTQLKSLLIYLRFLISYVCINFFSIGIHSFQTLQNIHTEGEGKGYYVACLNVQPPN